jgi:hypothetical protein
VVAYRFKLKILFNNLRYAAYLAVFQTYLYSAGMESRTCKQFFYNAAGKLAAALVFFKDDVYFESGVYVCPVLSHDYTDLFFDCTDYFFCDFTDFGMISPITYQIQDPLVPKRIGN